MLNYLWGIMILVGVFWGILSGRPAELTDGILTGAKDAVSLCITMAGVMAFWCGLPPERISSLTAEAAAGAVWENMCCCPVCGITEYILWMR